MVRRRKPTLIAGGLLALALVSGAVAGPYEDGQAASKRGDYAEAVRLWRPLAEQGDAKAQFWLGVMYFNGQGLPQGFDQAATWFRKAADQGYAAAQNGLGTVFALGRASRQDLQQAAAWRRKAAEQGNASAQYALATMYHSGQGVPQDDTQAAAWFRKPPTREMRLRNLARGPVPQRRRRAAGRRAGRGVVSQVR